MSWIQKNTIKSNILFFKKYNKEKYDKVLDKCQLYYDLDNRWKGENLSNGQKARISIVRAVYSNPDKYLFDDQALLKSSRKSSNPTLLFPSSLLVFKRLKWYINESKNFARTSSSEFFPDKTSGMITWIFWCIFKNSRSL